MKKLILILAVLVAAPAFAALDVFLVDNGDGTVTVRYEGAPADANRPRAFGLDIQVDAPAVITAVGSVSTDYNIFPGSIVIDGNTGTVTNPGTPLAVSTDPGSGTGLGTGHIVLEMGSLYEDGVDSPPATDGNLCTLTIDCNGGSDVNVVMVDEDAYRGGLVLEDGTQGDVSDSIVVCAGGTSCRDMFNATEQALYDRYTTAGSEPLCWCNQYQCRGDADNAEEALFIVGNLRVYNGDLNVLAASWKKTPETGANPCADFDHAEEALFIVGNLSVYNNDLNILATNWKKTDAQLSDCPSYLP